MLFFFFYTICTSTSFIIREHYLGRGTQAATCLEPALLIGYLFNTDGSLSGASRKIYGALFFYFMKENVSKILSLLLSVTGVRTREEIQTAEVPVSARKGSNGQCNQADFNTSQNLVSKQKVN